jgi:hypothetical protein
MDWSQVLTIVGANIALFLWATRQGRTDFLHTSRILESIQSEMKDFHGRLCAIEERNKK